MSAGQETLLLEKRHLDGWFSAISGCLLSTSTTHIERSRPCCGGSGSFEKAYFLLAMVTWKEVSVIITSYHDCTDTHLWRWLVCALGVKCHNLWPQQKWDCVFVCLVVEIQLMNECKDSPIAQQQHVLPPRAEWKMDPPLPYKIWIDAGQSTWRILSTDISIVITKQCKFTVSVPIRLTACARGHSYLKAFHMNPEPQAQEESFTSRLP